MPSKLMHWSLLFGKGGGQTIFGHLGLLHYRHLMISLYQAHAYNVELTSLQNYKAQYKATQDDNKPIRDVSTPATHDAWVEGRAVRDAKVKERQRLMEGWIDGLVALDGEERPQMTEDGDRIMVDAGNATTAEGESGESPLVQALRQRKRRLQRGFVGERMVELLAKMEDSQRLLEETRNRYIEGPRQQLQITSSTTETGHDGDSEMVEIMPASSDPTDFIPTLRSINERMNRIKMGVSDADVWVMDNYMEDFQRAVDKKVEKYLENLGTSKKDPLELVRSSRDNVLNERIGTEALMRLLGDARVFDASVERDRSSVRHSNCVKFGTI